MIAGAMTAIVAMIASNMSVSLSRTMADSIRATNLASELAILREALRRDLAGTLPKTPQGELKAAKLVGIMISGDQLRLCFDGGTYNGVANWANPDRVITYFQLDGQLLRTDSMSGETFVAARHLQEFNLSSVIDGYRVDLLLGRHGAERTATWILPSAF